jgi:predicted amidohydrolase YtcJ
MATPQGPADLVVLGRVLTLDPGRPAAGGVAAAGGKVLAVGTREEVRALAGPGAEVHDAGGGSVLPGFRDAHLHLLSLGRQEARADLHGLDLAGVRAALAARAAALPPGSWVEGAGWTLESLGLGRPPDAADIAESSGGRPAVLYSHDWHSALVSVEGMALLGLLGDDPLVPGTFDRDARGIPTGLLREAAVFAAAGVASAAAGEADDRAAVRAACARLLSRGITAADDMDGGRSLRAAAALRRSGALGVRVRAALRPPDLGTFERTGLRPAVEDEGLRVAGLKVFLDGALGSRTAWMLDPYDDDPSNRGMRTLEPGDLDALVARAAALGLPCFVHAIGDAAVRAALDALAKAPGLPHRVEHAQCVHPDDVPRFRALGIAASMQPGHMATDIPAAVRAWGRRGARAFPLRSLLDAGAEVLLGSDAPVEPAEPLRWVHAAAERRTPAGEPEGGWWPEERVSREEALALAVAGPIRPGGPADLVAYDADVLAVEAGTLPALRPVRVWAAGAAAGGPPG